MIDAENADSSEEVKASAIHTEVYLRKNFITPEDLNEDGLYVDEYTSRSERVLVEFDDKETTIRHIKAEAKKGGILPLPTLDRFEIDTDILKQVAKVSRLSDIDSNRVVELSGLASIKVTSGTDRRKELQAFDATRQVYSQSLRVALDEGHDLWVMNVDDKMLGFLDRVLGEGSYKILGEPKKYIGPETTPIAMRPFDVVESILDGEDNAGRFQTKNKKDMQHALDGVSERHLSSSLRKLLRKNEIETTPLNPMQKVWNEVWRNKTTGVYAFIIGYSAVRFAGVATVDEFDGSVPLFAAIDVGTAITQVGSMEMFFRGKDRVVRALGALGTGASFAAPYAYFWANGEGYPAYVNVIAGAAVAVGAGLETKKSIKDAHLKKSLIRSDLEPNESITELQNLAPMGN